MRAALLPRQTKALISVETRCLAHLTSSFLLGGGGGGFVFDDNNNDNSNGTENTSLS